MAEIGRNEPCPCGSKKKYKHCCLTLDQGRQERRDVLAQTYSLLDRNMALLIAVNDIFQLDKPWETVKKNMTDARIREFYQFVAALWPPETDYRHLLPKPDSTLRALYLGENDPESMLENVFRFSLYADQIILIHPFQNPNCVAEQFNPMLHPGTWRIETLRLVYHLRILAPWIAAGLVLLVPDPGDFDYALRTKSWILGVQRLRENPITDADIDRSSMKKRATELFFLAPSGFWESEIREQSPELSDEEVENLVAYIKKSRTDNPLLPNETLDEMPGQFTSYSTGATMDIGLYLCQAIGAFPYTNVPYRWKEIQSAGDKLSPTAQIWSPFTNAFGKLDFKFLNMIDSKFAVGMREEGRLESFRTYMRKLWNTVGGDLDPSKADMLARDFRDELTDEYAKARADWDAIDRDLLKWGVPAIGGAVAAVGGLATGLYTVAIPGAGFVGKGINELIQAHLKRKEFRKKTPLSVFIDLDKKK